MSLHCCCFFGATAVDIRIATLGHFFLHIRGVEIVRHCKQGVDMQTQKCVSNGERERANVRIGLNGAVSFRHDKMSDSPTIHYSIEYLFSLGTKLMQNWLMNERNMMHNTKEEQTNSKTRIGSVNRHKSLQVLTTQEYQSTCTLARHIDQHSCVPFGITEHTKTTTAQSPSMPVWRDCVSIPNLN